MDSNFYHQHQYLYNQDSNICIFKTKVGKDYFGKLCCQSVNLNCFFFISLVGWKRTKFFLVVVIEVKFLIHFRIALSKIPTVVENNISLAPVVPLYCWSYLCVFLG